MLKVLLAVFLTDRFFKFLFLFFSPSHVSVNPGLGLGLWPQYGEVWTVFSAVFFAGGMIGYLLLGKSGTAKFIRLDPLRLAKTRQTDRSEASSVMQGSHWDKNRFGNGRYRLLDLMVGIFMGAVLGNLIDRLYYGGVMDITLVYWLPALNLADILLTMVFLVLLWLVFRGSMPTVIGTNSKTVIK